MLETISVLSIATGRKPIFLSRSVCLGSPAQVKSLLSRMSSGVINSFLLKIRTQPLSIQQSTTNPLLKIRSSKTGVSSSMTCSSSSKLR